ncbi:unnamed protein product, partial [Symbiodinium microadriaticum]
MSLLSYLLSHSHVAMFGDFSLKALIKDWNEPVLGKCPLVNLGETSNSLRLEFSASALLECPNAQLQNVGNMCESGVATVHTMACTIVFGVDQSVLPLTEGIYNLEILTVVTNSNKSISSVHPISGNAVIVGTAGHVVLRYASGGTVLVSAGHWIELSNLSGVDEDVVLRNYDAQMGEYEGFAFR